MLLSCEIYRLPLIHNCVLIPQRVILIDLLMFAFTVESSFGCLDTGVMF